MGEIKAVCISEKKGTPKKSMGAGVLVKSFGLEGDAHAGTPKRQVSILPYEKVMQFREEYPSTEFGAFGENLVISGYDFKTLGLGTKIFCGGCILKITQIGKECHTGCSVAKMTGRCIMPTEGVFAEVLCGGRIKAGDSVTVEKPFTAAAITISDRCSRGQSEDKSGPLLRELLEADGFSVKETKIIPDEYDLIESELVRLCDGGIDLIITTGGTGFSKRDNTPEATLSAATRNIPGIAEAIRAESAKYTKNAMLGRGVSVIRNDSIIINFPGSPKAVRESYEVIRGVIDHAIGILKGNMTD